MTASPRFDTPHPITAKVEMAYGTLRVIATDRADTVVSVRPHDESKALDIKTAERTRVTHDKGLLTVLSARGLTFRTGAIDIVVELPSHSIVDIAVASAEVRAEGDFADVRFQSASGDLIIDTITGGAKVDTASGGISIRELNGNIGFNAASGELAIKALRGQVKAATASGSISIGSAVTGGLIFDTASGNTSLGIAEGTAAHLQIDTRSGVVTNALESADGPAQGDETFQLRIRSASGDVDLHRPVVLAG
ncbi:DUF4097 domain-containing protein [Mycobacterium sp. CBMA271]|uniref:DUF4097 family beta strand repeat-containing protein n=1 Tax=unclassified Mycobacteroides TaxID=2618759 RepID=UPI0012DDCA0F|nr:MULTISPECIES: DUF4097 family beta strand repeat-containing protein [unclassified Mycobacteroides]MUM19971.1 hypothetical protein [Mycobacteroides sp. CBMA 326]MUM20145.1 DUF4097 domain-containing protein [Mycobacteroides sp. CBMA 271]